MSSVQYPYITFFPDHPQTLQLTLGTDIYTVSKLLGHSDVRVTQIYAKLIDEKRDEAMDRMNILKQE